MWRLLRPSRRRSWSRKEGCARAAARPASAADEGEGGAAADDEGAAGERAVSLSPNLLTCWMKLGPDKTPVMVDADLKA